MSCPICQKRKSERFCPAKAEKICAVCCGTEREVSIDCPAGCAYLASAHRYEARQQRPLRSDTPLLDERVRRESVEAHGPLLSALAFTIAKFSAAEASCKDPDVLEALRTLAETYKTLRSGIVYEQPPFVPVQRGLYEALSRFLEEVKQPGSHASFAPVKDGAIFDLLVFLYRMGLVQTNGRPRSRRFIEFLRSQFPGAREGKREEPRIIVP